MAITRAQQARQMLKKGSTKPVVQGGGPNYLGKQKTVSNVPIKWQSGPNKPPTELAYITEAEKKLLLKEDIHGSLKDGPNKGPKGIISLNGDLADMEAGITGADISAAERGETPRGMDPNRAAELRAGFVAAGGQKTKEEKKDKGFQRKVKEIKKTFSPLSRYNRNQRKKYLNKIQKNIIDELNAKLLGLENFDGFYGDTEETYGDFIKNYAPSITEFGPKGTGKYSQQFIDDVLSGKRKPPESFAPIDIANVPGGLLTKGLAAGANIFGKAVAGPTTLEELMDLYSGDKGSYIRARDLNIDDVTSKEMMKEFEPNRFKLLNPEFEGAEPDPCKGPNPPAYCFTGIRSVESETTEPEPEQLLTSRILGTQFAADGGRIGFANGAQFTSGGNISPGTDVKGNVRDDNPYTGGGGGGGPSGPPSVINPPPEPKTIRDRIKDRERKKFNFAKNFNPLNLLFGTPVGASEMTPEEKEQLLKDAGIESGTLDQKSYKDTIKKVIDGDTVTAGGEITDVIPDLSNPDVLNKIAIDLGLPTEKKGIKFVTEKDVATPETASVIKEIQGYKRKGVGGDPELKLSAPEIIDFYGTDGQYKGLGADEVQSIYDVVSLPGQNRFTAAGGGIASLDREAFLLGGLAKGLKKAVRGIKKLAKSPIGKAALVGAGMFGIPGTSFGGIFGKGALSRIIGQKAMTTAPFAPGTGILGFMQANPMATIFGVSALAGLTAKKDEGNKELEKYLASQKLDPSLSVRGTGSEFDFYGGQFVADGGRIGYQEGSKEPVAKKTLPLIDMDGMEKDYRETGGFVEMGRMEKADDVPARLSKNEFVFTADAVRNAGEGDIDKGAEVMYNMMKNLEAGGEVSEESQGLEGAREMFQTSQRLGEVI